MSFNCLVSGRFDTHVRSPKSETPSNRHRSAVRVYSGPVLEPCYNNEPVGPRFLQTCCCLSLRISLVAQVATCLVLCVLDRLPSWSSSLMAGFSSSG